MTPPWVTVRQLWSRGEWNRVGLAATAHDIPRAMSQYGILTYIGMLLNVIARGDVVLAGQLCRP